MDINNLIKKRYLIIKEIFNELNHNGINYALIRGFERLPYINHDLDILLSKENHNKFKQLLKKVSLNNGFKAYECLHHGATGYGFDAHSYHIFISDHKFNKNFLRLKLDVMMGYHLFGTTIPAKILLKKKHKKEWYYILSQESNIFLKTLQISKYIEKGDTATEKFFQYYSEIDSRSNWHLLKRVIRKYIANKYAISYVEAIEKKQWLDAKKYSRKFKILNLLYNILFNFNNTFNTSIRQILWIFKKRIIRCGLIVYIERIDRNVDLNSIRQSFNKTVISDDLSIIKKIAADGGVGITQNTNVKKMKPDVVLNKCENRGIYFELIQSFIQKHNEL
jgi:hypothetical protein